LLMQLRSEILGTVRTSVEVADSAWLTSRRCEAWLQVLDRVISYTPNFSAALVLLRVNMRAHNSIQLTKVLVPETPLPTCFVDVSNLRGKGKP
jgi:hypothetical protein